MADYIARYSKDPDKPVVTHSQAGEALVYTPYGTLAVASKLDGFICVEPHKQAWTFTHDFPTGGLETATEA